MTIIFKIVPLSSFCLPLLLRCCSSGRVMAIFCLSPPPPCLNTAAAADQKRHCPRRPKEKRPLPKISDALLHTYCTFQTLCQFSTDANPRKLVRLERRDPIWQLCPSQSPPIIMPCMRRQMGSSPETSLLLLYEHHINDKERERREIAETSAY